MLSIDNILPEQASTVATDQADGTRFSMNMNHIRES